MSLFQFGGAIMSGGVAVLERVACFNNTAVVQVRARVLPCVSLCYVTRCHLRSRTRAVASIVRAISPSSTRISCRTLPNTCARLPHSRPARLNFSLPTSGCRNLIVIRNSLHLWLVTFFEFVPSRACSPWLLLPSLSPILRFDAGKFNFSHCCRSRTYGV